MRRRSESCPRREGGGRSAEEGQQWELSQNELQMGGWLPMAPGDSGCFLLVCVSSRGGAASAVPGAEFRGASGRQKPPQNSGFCGVMELHSPGRRLLRCTQDASSAVVGRRRYRTLVRRGHRALGASVARATMVARRFNPVAAGSGVALAFAAFRHVVLMLRAGAVVALALAALRHVVLVHRAGVLQANDGCRFGRGGGESQSQSGSGQNHAEVMFHCRFRGWLFR